MHMFYVLVVINLIFAGKIFNILASYGVCVLGKGGGGGRSNIGRILDSSSLKHTQTEYWISTTIIMGLSRKVLYW